MLIFTAKYTTYKYKNIHGIKHVYLPLMAMSNAVPFPIPVLAPVIITVLPSRDSIIIHNFAVYKSWSKTE